MKLNQTATLVLLAAAIACLPAIAQRGGVQTQQQSQQQPSQSGQSQSGQTQSGQSQPSQSKPAGGMSGMPGMQMDDMEHEARVSGFDDSNPDKKKRNPDGAAAATKAMSGDMADDDDMHMDMGPHMHMTTLRAPSAADQQRADEIVSTLRTSIAKYEDYHAALADGYKIFGPNVPQPQYHFTNSRYALKAQFVFDAEHPTSLLYKKTADGYQLAGAMYTAPRRYTDEQLNERVPLSIARWHEHVNFCLPRLGTPIQSVDWKQFGLKGSIVTEEACDAAGGRWYPIVFGWMVHVYPFESDPAKVWAH
jgi:hypothetical protein